MKMKLVTFLRHLFCTIIFVCLVIFSLFNYKDHCIFTSPLDLIPMDSITREDQSNICQLQLDYNTLGEVPIDATKELTFKEIQSRINNVSPGGVWRPTGCTSYQKVAIVIPYRNRLNHLKILIQRLHPFLQTQKIDYRIFVIEQMGTDIFNKGRLFNAGFLESLKIDRFNCFIFHDVDLLPESENNLYLCDNHLRQYSSAIDETRYHVMFYNNAGGVVGMNAENFKAVNGYPNSYWGWGNEDDDLSARVQESGLFITRPPENIGKFKMIRHNKETRSKNGYQAFIGWRGRWRKDGLNTAAESYTVVNQIEEPLYTNITIDVGPSHKQMIDFSKDTTRESLWWFIHFYFP